MLIFSLSREFHSQVDPEPSSNNNTNNSNDNQQFSTTKLLYVIFLALTVLQREVRFLIVVICGDGRCGRRPGECGPTRLPRRCSAPGASNLGGRVSVSALDINVTIRYL